MFTHMPMSGSPWDASIVSNELPRDIADEVAGWPEFRMGVKRVRVELSDGRTFEDVMVAGDRVVGVLGREEVPFAASDVVAVTDFADAPLPPGY
jgi:hypothetical protein